MLKMPRSSRADVQKHFGEIPDGIKGRAMGFSNGKWGHWIMCWIDEGSPSVGVLAHEALHMAWFTLGDRGLELTDSSQEAFTYYTEKITNELARLVYGRTRL